MPELLPRQDTKNILGLVAEDNPKVVDDLVPNVLPGYRAEDFQGFTRKRISFRDSVTILDVLSEAAVMTKKPVRIAEYVRRVVRALLVNAGGTQAGDPKILGIEA